MRNLVCFPSPIPSFLRTPLGPTGVDVQQQVLGEDEKDDHRDELKQPHRRNRSPSDSYRVAQKVLQIDGQGRLLSGTDGESFGLGRG